jgi:hypothetical protein
MIRCLYLTITIHLTSSQAHLNCMIMIDFVSFLDKVRGPIVDILECDWIRPTCLTCT